MDINPFVLLAIIFTCIVALLLMLFVVGIVKPVLAKGDVWAQATIDVGVTNDYHSFTKAFNCRQDYYIECKGSTLINVTPVGNPINLGNVTGLCST
jgi:hypothetical protein